MTSLKDAVVLVTGANGGIGGHFVREALARGLDQGLRLSPQPTSLG